MERATIGERDALARSLRQHISEWDDKAKSAVRMLQSSSDPGEMIAWAARSRYAVLMSRDWRARLQSLMD